MMYIRRLKTMNIPFQLHTVQQMTDEVALLDSGVTENFVDKRVCQDLKLERFKLSKSLTMYNMDGTENK
jgi:hypothetical protein